MAGPALRPLAPGSGPFLALSTLTPAGVAVTNVLLPVVVKQRFPTRVGATTGLCSMALNAGASVAAAVTVPVARLSGTDWRTGLGVWAVVAALALPSWAAPARTRSAGPAGAPEPGPPASGAASAVRLTRDPTAWALAVHSGLQATAAYVVIGWLPQILRDAGLSASAAGLLSAVTSVLGVPLSFALGAPAGRLRGQSGIAVVIGLRGRDGPTVVRLSAFAQSTGYLLSVPAPIVVGALSEHSGGWSAPLLLMAVLMVPQLAAGFLAGRDRRVG
ncbi:hypothetical protein [Streptomyces sp. CRN 30]|uniref:hypothetical protein n=1 Tax=Streptomyces sp. CRN 30 TaxID=3075613 RepID=UPI002A83E2AA|nr:hypothetical protein [Streptomyces sp. CRN 30]